MEPTTLTFLADQGRIYLSTTIGGADHELGRFPNETEAALYANKWIGDRGLRWGRNSARILDEAQRLDACCVTFDVVPDDDEARARAWVAESEGILPWPFMP